MSLDGAQIPLRHRWSWVPELPKKKMTKKELPRLSDTAWEWRGDREKRQGETIERELKALLSYLL